MEGHPCSRNENNIGLCTEEIPCSECKFYCPTCTKIEKEYETCLECFNDWAKNGNNTIQK